MNTLEQKLVEYGLHEYEAKLYVAAMEIGPSPVQAIAKKAVINRVSAYNFINTLIEKGLMSTYEQGKRTMYAASDPTHLVNIFEGKRREIEIKEKEFQNFLPQLRSIYNLSENKPVVRYYEGLEGALVMNDEMMQGHDETIEMVYNKEAVYKFIPENIRKDLVAKRIQKNIKTLVILDGQTPTTTDGTRYSVDSKKFPIKADITFYKDKTRMISFGKDISGIIIENKDITDTLRSLFYMSLEYLKSNQDQK